MKLNKNPRSSDLVF